MSTSGMAADAIAVDGGMGSAYGRLCAAIVRWEDETGEQAGQGWGGSEIDGMYMALCAALGWDPSSGWDLSLAEEAVRVWRQENPTDGGADQG